MLILPLFCGNVLRSKCKRLTDLGVLWYFIIDWMSSFSLTFCQYIISSQKKGKHRKHKGLKGKIYGTESQQLPKFKYVAMEKSEPNTVCTIKLNAMFIIVHPLFLYFLFKFTSPHSFKSLLVMKMQIWAWLKYYKFCTPKGLYKCLLATHLRRHFVNIGQ